MEAADLRDWAIAWVRDWPQPWVPSRTVPRSVSAFLSRGLCGSSDPALLQLGCDLNLLVGLWKERDAGLIAEFLIW